MTLDSIASATIEYLSIKGYIPDDYDPLSKGIDLWYRRYTITHPMSDSFATIYFYEDQAILVGGPPGTVASRCTNGFYYADPNYPENLERQIRLTP